MKLQREVVDVRFIKSATASLAEEWARSEWTKAYSQITFGETTSGSETDLCGYLASTRFDMDCIREYSCCVAHT